MSNQDVLLANLKPGESMTVSMQPEVTLSECKLRELWNKGILPDLAYISFALEIESNEPNFNAESFARNWSISPEDLTDLDHENGWKAKKLKARSVLNAIGILEEKGFASFNVNVQISQLSLFE